MLIHPEGSLHMVSLSRHSPPVLLILQLLAFYARLTNIPCTFVQNSRINHMTRWLQFWKRMTSAWTAWDPVITWSNVSASPCINVASVRNHITPLHLEPPMTVSPAPTPTDLVPLHGTTRNTSNSLLMTCCILVDAPDGTSFEARALLNCSSSA